MPVMRSAHHPLLTEEELSVASSNLVGYSHTEQNSLTVHPVSLPLQGA
uniref:Uncharacterized protein n=2 Tax=Anguilla anguilla TaxID=7936 RepID=A0A0E9U751_ANGAN